MNNHQKPTLEVVPCDLSEVPDDIATLWGKRKEWLERHWAGRTGRVRQVSPWKEDTGLPIPSHCSALGLVAPLQPGAGGPVSQVAQLPLSLKDNGWHHLHHLDHKGWPVVCLPGWGLRGSGENLAAWHPIKPHGILILGQEQVRVGGGMQIDIPLTPGTSGGGVAEVPESTEVSAQSDPAILQMGRLSETGPRD